MKRMVEKMLHQFGTDAIVTTAAGSRIVRAIIQPTRSRARQTIEGDQTPLGQIPQGQYTYIGPAEPEIARTDRVEIGSLRLRFARVETVWDGNRPLYRWGLCYEEGGDDTWALKS